MMKAEVKAFVIVREVVLSVYTEGDGESIAGLEKK
jgi:hypothetical protein